MVHGSPSVSCLFVREYVEEGLPRPAGIMMVDFLQSPPVS